jgi:hypothetical protein
MQTRYENYYYTLFNTRSVPVIYLEGSDDPQFGKKFEGAFLPFPGKDNTTNGLYFIANKQKLFWRYISNEKVVTLRVNLYTECDLLSQLSTVFDSVMHTREMVTFFPPAIAEPNAHKYKVRRTETDLVVAERFLELRGQRNDTCSTTKPEKSYDTEGFLTPGSVNFTFRSK